MDEINELYQEAYLFYQNQNYLKAIDNYEILLKKITDKGSNIQIAFNISICLKELAIKTMITMNNNHQINDDNFPHFEDSSQIITYLEKSLIITNNLIKNTEYNDRFTELNKNIITNNTDICTIITKIKNNNDDSYIYRALAYDFKNYILYYNLGIINRNKEDFFKAILFFKQSLHLNPKYSMAYTELSLVYRVIGDYPSAIEILKKGLNYLSKDCDIMNNLAIIYMDIRNFKECKNIYKKIIQIIDENGDKIPGSKSILNRVYINMGCLYNKIGDSKQGIFYFDKSLELQFHLLSFQNKLLDVNYIDDQENSIKYIKECPQVFKKVLEIEGINKVSNTLKLQRGEKIRIAYVSGDFKNHAVSFFIQSLLSIFDKDKFEVYAISTNTLNDNTVQKYPFVKFIKAKFIKPKEIYNMIKNLKIHILIDLAGHTMHNMLVLFKARACPIQLTYIGYPNTTGLYEMDYKIVDNISDPIQSSQFYTEKLIRLPRMFLDYTPPDYLPDIIPRDNDKIIFGSMNRLAKINEDILSCWRQILKRVPNSQIWIKDRLIFDSEFIDQDDLIFKFFNTEEMKRLVFFNYCNSHEDHLSWLNNIHISLDTWPYSFTTGAMESLSMGVPIITKTTPNVHASNVCSSILYHCDMKDWIASDNQQYIQIAVQKSEEIIKNGLDKEAIKKKFNNSCILDHNGFIKLYEETLLDMIKWDN